ncbi:MAG: PAN domain-containing protein, partial [Hyphomicrobiaceae bacterium]
MTRIDGRRLVAVLGLTLAAMLAAGTAVAETYFEKVENKVLVGSAFARLRGLTYEQCQERCLRESRCLAFEHYRGGGVIRRSSNCALFSSVREAKSSTWSDIAYKRQSVAAEGAAPVKKKAARSYSRRDDAEGAVAGSPVPGAGRASPPAEPRIRPAEAPQRSAEAPQPPAPPSAQSRPATRGLAPSASAPSSSAPAIARDVAPAGGAAPPGDRFHIVPVFYGTDRNQVKQAGRIGYANDRAKRLELGRALVSVPLDHKVPNIERPRAWTIPYIGTIQLEKEDPAKHFTVREIKVLTKQELLDQVKQRLNGSRS